MDNSSAQIDSGSQSAPADAAATICITVCTRKRPKMLERCLSSLAPQLAQSGVADRIVVIENDVEPQSRQVIENVEQRFPGVAIDYRLEPELGIPFARNRALDEADASGCAWMAFVDDDEWAAPDWLEVMRGHIASFRARGVAAEVLAGPVDYMYPDTVPVWYKKRRPINKETGAELDTAATSNTLYDLEWHRAQERAARFDPEMRFTGGSDKDFFIQVHRRGGRIRWVADAFVSEDVLPDQLTMLWQARRAQRYSAVQVYRDRKFDPGWKSEFRNLSRALRRLVGAGLLFPFALLLTLFNRRLGATSSFSCLKKIYMGVGGLRGMIALPPQPYKTVIGH